MATGRSPALAKAVHDGTDLDAETSDAAGTIARDVPCWQDPGYSRLRRVVMSGFVGIPAEELTHPAVPLPVCVRHGAPATRRVTFAVKSRPEVSTPRGGNGAVMTARLGEWARKTRVVRADGWPLCVRCAAVRAAGLVLANVMFWGGLLLLAGVVVVRISAGAPDTGLVLPMLTGMAAVLGSVVPFVWGSLPRLTRTHASPDAASVLVERPHPAFAARWPGSKSADRPE